MTAAADIYSLGVILFELLTGRPPFARESVGAILEAHQHDDAPLPASIVAGVPDALQRICLKCLEKPPSERYPTVNALARDLRRYLAGEVVEVRPSQYDNALASRARRHLSELSRWRQERLLTEGEYAKLAAVYMRFDRSGFEAALESRRIHPGLVLLLFGGWLLIDGSILWLLTRWDDLGVSSKVVIGCIPAVIVNVLWWLFWRVGSFRAGHVMMFLGILALPAALAVPLHTLGWLAIKVGNPGIDFPQFSNAQVLMALAVTSWWAWFLTRKTRTVLVSTTTVVLFGLHYFLWLDCLDLQKMLEEHLARFALLLSPLVVTYLVTGLFLARHRSSRAQAIPWFTGALALFIGASLALAWAAPKEWVHPYLFSQKNQGDIQPEAVRGLLFAVCGCGFLVKGLWLRREFLVSARAAYMVLLWSAPLVFLYGFFTLNVNWPGLWGSVPFFGARATVGEFVFLAACVLCIFAAPLLQVRTYAFVGLAGLTCSEWRLNNLLLNAKSSAWAATLVTASMLLLVLTSMRLLWLRSKSEHQEMDDVAEDTHEFRSAKQRRLTQTPSSGAQKRS